MAGIMVPKSRIEEPLVQGGANAHPEGQWNGQLDRAWRRDLPYVPSEGAGYTAPGDVEIIKLQFGGSRSLNGAGETTNQKVFMDLVVRDGEIHITDERIPDSSWQMQRSLDAAAKIAEVFGELQEVEFEGEVFLTTSDDFVDRLGEGEFDGRDIGYDVFQRKFKKRDGSAGVEAVVKDFFQVV